MERKHITSTADLKALFPELDDKSKFRKALDTIFDAGLTVTITKGGYFEACQGAKALFACIVETGNLPGQPYVVRTTDSGTKVFAVKWEDENPAVVRVMQQFFVAGLKSKHYMDAEAIDANPDAYRNVDRSQPSISRHKADNGPWIEHTSYPAERDDRRKVSWAALALVISKVVDKNKVQWMPCGNCHGTGYLTWTSYANGVCFQCGGAGGRPIVKTEEELARERALKARLDYDNEQQGWAG